ncbi:FecR family protein [Flavivirga amylovorans]|uniref:FecR family protein n=1 Tax=Flavivirga amylovorans TaxID=870486 RepID=A0ABT8WZD6_9FLAO|nr:FecR family protein [Flavivirga amylovorans]MDO5987041.1 FecR family protein [Flavivirga amylovorans]
MFEEKDDTILARWLAGTLTQEELAEFKNSKEFAEYQSIVTASNRFEKPAFNKEKLYTNIAAKRKNQKSTKVISLKSISYVIAVAASIVLIIGVFFNNITYKTGIGEQLAVTLPDNSKIQLNANSKLEHNRFFWNSNRNVSLNGEAYFIVEKGSTFNVKTNYGTVSVLGTEFNIRSRKNAYNLICYEGKVMFKQNKTEKTAVLTAGKSISIINNDFNEATTTKTSPSWLKGISTFDNTMLSDVLNELRAQYGITIKTNGVDLSQRFTGNFVHNDLETALKTVLVPMQIEYTINKNILLLNSSKE